MALRERDVRELKHAMNFAQSQRDGVRRKAVQRARNAMNKELRRKAKEESK